MITINDEELRLPDFADIWFTNCDARYRCLKGGRSTGKTYNFIAIEAFFKIFSDPRRNILMVRQNDKDNAQSNFTILKNVARKLGIYHLFKFTVSPHRVEYKRTGQVILFGGMNDVENIQGTSVSTGYWTDIYFEEAAQLKSYEEFRVVDGSIRVPNYEPDLKVQITFLFNAWDIGHWLYDKFFQGRLEDDEHKLETDRFQFYYNPDFNIGYGYGVALHISSLFCNIYASEGQIEGAKILKETAPDLYRVEVLGCWGNVGDRTYPHFSDDLIMKHHELTQFKWDCMVVGIDFGMSNGEGKIKYSEDNAKRLGSANTCQLIGVANDWDVIVALDEYFDSNEGRDDLHRKTSPQIQKEMIESIANWIKEFDLASLVCYVDCADSGGFIDGLILEAKQQGVWNVSFIPSSKIPILTRVYFENHLHAKKSLLYSNRCANLIRETKNARKAKDGKVREDTDDHAINAFEYAWIPVRKKLRNWKLFKDPNS